MVLGCFPLKSKKKRGSVSMKRVDLEESKPTALPEPPKIPSRNLQSAPPSFRTRVKPIHSNNGGTGDMSSRARVMSAPSSIHSAAERDFLAGVYHDEQDEQPRDPRTSTKESSPQPLPLPSPRTGSSLKNWGSLKNCTIGTIGFLTRPDYSHDWIDPPNSRWCCVVKVNVYLDSSGKHTV